MEDVYFALNQNCQKCTTPNFCVNCIDGFGSSLGLCQKCADNCLSCLVNGPAKCDTCKPGYVILRGTANCTACLNSCASCSDTDPSACSTCPLGTYQAL